MLICGSSDVSSIGEKLLCPRLSRLDVSPDALFFAAAAPNFMPVPLVS